MVVVNSHITLLDFVVLPYILGFIYAIAFWYANKHYPKGHHLRKHFFNGLTVKIIGAIFICFVYEYYYGYGDTFGYFNESKYLNNLIWESPTKWIGLMFSKPRYDSYEYYNEILNLGTYATISNFTVTKIASILGFFTFNTFLPTAVLFAFFSFTGIWVLYLAFVKLFPSLYSKLSIPILYFPSVIIWGSAIFKDTITLMALGWLLFSSLELFIYKTFRLRVLLMFVMSILLIAMIKIYILVAFIPALLYWIINTKTSSIENRLYKTLLRIFILSILSLPLYFIATSKTSFFGQYSVNNITETSQNLRSNLQKLSNEEGGSGYDLDINDQTLGGLLKKFPASVNVTLFRPYIWESSNFLMFFNAIESFTLLILTILILFKRSKIKIVKLLFSNNTIAFTLIFSLIFAFAIGASTYNFGSLSRYRIPCLPFYGVFLVLLYTQSQTKVGIIKDLNSSI